jgi:serine/threonine-protein kinase
MPHDVHAVVCPSTGQTIRSDKSGRRRSDHPNAGSAPPPARPPSASRPDAVVGKPTSRPSLPVAKHDLVGKTLDAKYTVRRVLGEGGMGTVFEAEHLAIGRLVAIKVLHPHQARKANSVKRFHQEARAAAVIGHPNICEVYDIGALEDGTPYLVMEKLVGETLADRIAKEGGLPLSDVIDVLVQVLSALVVAHDKRIVHRDVKPENVFLTRRTGCSPLVKVLDFGVSKTIAAHLDEEGPAPAPGEENVDLTRIGMVMGTPHYMSPEQARGERDLDGRVDLYACGVILYEALTGRRPFNAPNYERLLVQILSATPRPASELRPGLPRGFDAVIEKAMARNRSDRFENAAGFQRELLFWRAALGAEAAARPDPEVVDSSPSEAEVAAQPLRPDPRFRSVEIPISFSPDSVASGEATAAGPADAEAADATAEPTEVSDFPTDTTESTHPPSDPVEGEEDPTELMPWRAP